MLAHDFNTQNRFERLIENYQQHSNLRDQRLFSIFLMRGYDMTTLSSVAPEYREEALFAKMQLGMLITLMDDFADNPKFRDEKKLKQIYELIDNKNFTQNFKERGTKLAQFLSQGLFLSIRSLPNGHLLEKVFEFDLRQIVLANQYSEVITDFPGVANLIESVQYGPYNMGIVAAGMIDLIASKKFNKHSLGPSREIFLIGQRMGRIANVLTTFDREISEGDLTNEISIYLRNKIGGRKSLKQYKLSLQIEFEDLTKKIKSYDQLVEFDVHQYAKGLENFLALHRRLEGTI